MSDGNKKDDDPEVAADAIVPASPQEDENGIGPKGRWRKTMMDCTEVIGCTNLCVMSYCCNFVLLAQIMTRLGLDWCGMPNPAKAASTFSIVILVYFACWASYLMVFGVVFFPCLVFWMWAIQTRTRYEMRKYFEIPPDYCAACDGAGEDFCMTFWCTCCAGIQMHRHTHDENRYPYEFIQPTGLPEDAPPLYEDMSAERF